MNERLRLLYLKMYEDFSKKSIPEELKYIASQIRPDLINNGNKSFEKNYIFGSYKFNLIIDYIKGYREPYFSNLDFTEIFQTPYTILDIPVKVKDQNIDIDYLLSVIIHEVRHIYDIFNIESEYEVLDFYKGMQLQIFKNSSYQIFTNVIYLSLEHELIARHNMLYPSYRWLKITDKNKLDELYLKSYSYKSLIQLQNFDYIKFINKFKEEDLIIYTNEFIKIVAKETNFCNNKSDLISFYKKWSDFFKDKSNEYLKYVDNMLEEIITDIKNNHVFENKNWEYNEYIINGSYKIFKQFYNKIFSI